MLADQQQKEFRAALSSINQVSREYKSRAFFSIQSDYSNLTIEIIGANFERRWFEFLSSVCDTNNMTFAVSCVPHAVVINVYKV